MSNEENSAVASNGLVTITVADRRFAVPLVRVSHVFVPDRLCAVPLAPPEIAGLLNLRGRVVTALDLRTRFGLPARRPEDPMIALGVEEGGELFGLIADEAGEAIWAGPSGLEPAPSNLDARWAGLCAGVCRSDDGLMMVLDVDSVLNFGRSGLAA